MQTNNIKHTSIKDYLATQGIYPFKEHPAYGMYKSPFRDEKTASFKVDFRANLWYDFGTGEGGSIIDLVMKMQQCNFIQAFEQRKPFIKFFSRKFTLKWSVEITCCF